MTSEEIKKKRVELEAEKKKQKEELFYWEGRKRSALAKAEDEIERHYAKTIDPIESRISAIDEEFATLQNSCPRSDDKDEHGEGKTCSLCGSFTEICTGVD